LGIKDIYTNGVPCCCDLGVQCLIGCKTCNRKVTFYTKTFGALAIKEYFPLVRCPIKREIAIAVAKTATEPTVIATISPVLSFLDDDGLFSSWGTVDVDVVVVVVQSSDENATSSPCTLKKPVVPHPPKLCASSSVMHSTFPILSTRQVCVSVQVEHELWVYAKSSSGANAIYSGVYIPKYGFGCDVFSEINVAFAFSCDLAGSGGRQSFFQKGLSGFERFFDIICELCCCGVDEHCRNKKDCQDKCD